MARLALSAPTTALSSWTALTELPAAEAGTMGANTGFTFPNNGLVIVRYVNGSTAGNLLLKFTITVDGVAVADRQLAVSSSKAYILGPFKLAYYNDPATGLVTIDKSTSASGDTVGLYILPSGFNA